jgi:hypothetical protein
MEEMDYPSKVTNEEKYQHVLELTIEADGWLEQAYELYCSDLADAQKAYKGAVDMIYALEDHQLNLLNIFSLWMERWDGLS